MLTLSKPISAGQAQAYHKSEFANAKENYYTEGERVRGEWQGQLAARYGLRGEVNEEQFARLSEGQHPQTGEPLIRRQHAREYINDKGETTRTMEHRAGWDATFSAPKSVSLTALVGGDNRVREAHRVSVRVRVTSTCRRHDVDPQLYLTQLLTNLSQVRRSELPNWLPDQWKQLQDTRMHRLENSASLPS